MNIDLGACVDELAPLVCLKSDANLSEYVQEISESEVNDAASILTKYPYVDDRIRAIAEEYASNSRLVDRLLVNEDDDEENKAPTEVAQVQGHQLLDYLSGTRLGKGPTKDLIQLQNTGTIYGLDTSN